MNSNTQFRAWDGKQWVYEGIFLSHDRKLWKRDADRKMVEVQWPVVFFTGLKDKNGKEIYEGDLVNHDGDIYPVTYGMQCISAFTGYGWSIWSFYGSEGGDDKSRKEELIRELQIIGNIYQNPELLKNK